MKSWASILLLACLAGCEKRIPTYDGEPLKHWEQLAQSEAVADRTAAAKALGALGPDALTTLTKLVRDPDPHVRLAAEMSVTGIGQKGLPRLIEMLADPDPSVRAGAATALRYYGVDAKPAVAALTELLHDDDPMVRAVAAKTLRLVVLRKDPSHAPKPSGP